MCKDCIVLDERLRKLSFELWQVKKANTNLRGELNYERREKEKLIKEKKKGQKQHYRNGQKRSAHRMK